MKSKLFATGGNGPRRNSDGDGQDDTGDAPVDSSGKFEPKPAPVDADPTAPK